MKHAPEGIFPALTTPFSEESVSLEKLKKNIINYNAYPFSGYVILGSTGEAVYIADHEADDIAAASKEVTPEEKILIAGAGKESTRLTIQFSERMAEKGMDAVLVRTPSYYRSRLTPSALHDHYLFLAQRIPIPVLLYNIPQQTGITLNAEVVSDLSHQPNIIGIKDSSGDLAYFKKLLSLCHDEFNVITGAGNALLSGLCSGAKGAILAVANVLPDLCLELFSSFKRTDLDQATRIQKALIPLNTAITQKYGIAAAKYAMDLLGFQGGKCRSPLQPLSEDQKLDIKSMMNSLEKIDLKTKRTT